jgi:hypothetical protein
MPRLLLVPAAPPVFCWKLEVELNQNKEPNMAEVKKSFMLYADQYSIIGMLSTVQKAWLLDALFQHARGENITQEPDQVCGMAFAFIKQQMDRDAIKYAERAKRSKENGQKGGRPNNNPEEPKKPSGFSGMPEEPRKPDTDTDTDTVTDTLTDTVTVKDKEREEIEAKALAERSTTPTEQQALSALQAVGVETPKLLSKYCINDKVVRVTREQRDIWQNEFKYINVMEHLISISKTWDRRFEDGENTKGWFFATVNSLRAANNKEKIKKEGWAVL